MSGESPNSSSESPGSSSSTKYKPASPPPVSSESPDSWGESPGSVSTTKYNPSKTPAPQPIDQSDAERFLKGGPVTENTDTLPNSSKQKYK